MCIFHLGPCLSLAVVLIDLLKWPVVTAKCSATTGNVLSMLMTAHSITVFTSTLMTEWLLSG